MVYYMKDNSLKAVRYIFWLISISVMVLIFLFSSQNSAESSEVSSGLIRVILNLFDSFRNMNEENKLILIRQFSFFVRKGAHFGIFSVLGLSLFSAIYTYSIKLWKKFFTAIIISFVYAVSDEIHQTFVPGRAGMIKDVVVDLSGALVGILFVWILISIHSIIKNRGNKKMKKKELMSRLKGLVNTVEELNAKVIELKKENETLKLALEASVNGVKSEISFPRAEDEIVEEQVVSEGFSIKSYDEVESEEFAIEEPTFENIPIKKEPTLSNEAMEYGATIIGKITVESAKYCDIINSKNLQNAKELLGLIMGKSELCKSDILGIAQSNISYENKTEMIDAELFDAIEYFNSIIKQN